MIGKVLLTWAENLAESSITFFQANDKGAPKAIAELFRRARNLAMILIGDDRHRKALRVKQRLSDTPILFRERDRAKIFQPLIEALAVVDYWKDPEPEPEPDPEPDPDPEPELEPQITSKETEFDNLPEDNKSDRDREREKLAKANGTFYVPKTKRARDYKHLQTILSRYDMLERLVNYSKSNEEVLLLILRKTFVKYEDERAFTKSITSDRSSQYKQRVT